MTSQALSTDNSQEIPPPSSNNESTLTYTDYHELILAEYAIVFRDCAWTRMISLEMSLPDPSERKTTVDNEIRHIASPTCGSAYQH
jgi:hypothetical protein